MAEIAQENWKPVVGFEGFYEVSDLGRVRTVSRLLPQQLAGPYPKVSLTKGGRRKGIMRHAFEVHVLVAAAFLGERPKGYVTDHVNTVKWDNRAVNLEYVTRAENARRAWQMLPMSRPPHFTGERHWKCKVTDEIRRTLIVRSAKGESTRALAREYGLNPHTVWTICKDRRKRVRNGR